MVLFCCRGPPVRPLVRTKGQPPSSRDMYGMILGGAAGNTRKVQVGAATGSESHTFLKTISITDTRATKPAERANGFANNGCGRSRMQLDRAVAYDASEQA